MGLDFMTLDAIQHQVTDAFATGFNRAPVDYTSYVTEIPSTERNTIAEWIDSLGTMRKWVGPRQIEDFEKNSYTIVNEKYELTKAITNYSFYAKSQTTLADIIKRKIGSMGEQVRIDFPSQLTIAALDNGLTDLAFDGVAFFSNVSGVRIIDNLAAGTGTTEAQLLTDLTTVWGTMASFTDNKGLQLNLVPTGVVCHPLLGLTFASIFTKNLISGSTNPFADKFKLSLTTDGRLTDTNDWYLVCKVSGLTPIVYSSLSGVRVQTDDSLVFKEDKLLVGCDAAGNAGYSFPQLAIRVVNS